ncbi:hypothetical protein Godav_000539 [Gossypium davidsonii]|uniref:DDE-1 domain-containing protein n=4 Tax=Gossypium TaxID=3633 RepID=A0A7J8SZX4_GOSDV|nr:hypothetical protein [Gossypium davidsonii]
MGLSLIEDLVKVQLEGRKNDKKRLTVVVCCNGDCSDKVPLWVIGKFANPRCFKHVTERKVLLTVDNCPAHPKVIECLRNVELFFLPPNSTNTMNVEQILNYPSENKSLIELPTDEKIIQ